ncbi:hypothetical protein BLNAU_20590 [Blattamonas nauphoetae]|uniref:Uncharacterized protein n=1 Tax=Blattamonas nauphoetae TaxID=2049346 RepID=A0ABQ9WYU4_9EUKA|nr:hypothetical protein BLNAU_20590 [Blattamonas nauphoetae]
MQSANDSSQQDPSHGSSDSEVLDSPLILHPDRVLRRNKHPVQKGQNSRESRNKHRHHHHSAKTDRHRRSNSSSSSPSEASYIQKKKWEHPKKSSQKSSKKRRHESERRRAIEEVMESTSSSSDSTSGSIPIRKEKRRHADKSLKRRSRTSKHKTKPKKTCVDEHRKKLVSQRSKNRHYHGDDELLVKLEKLQKLDRENETISSERDIVAHKTSLLKKLKERDHKFNKTWLESVASNHRRDRLSARTAITKSLFNIDQTIIISVSDGQLVTTLRNRALATATESSLTTVALLIDLHRQMEQLLPRNNILDTIEECIILSADSATRSNLAAYFTDNTAVDFAKRLEISLPFNPNGSSAQQVFPPHSSPTPSPAPFVPQHSSQVFAQRGTGVPPAKSNTPRFNKPRPNTQSGR